MSDGWRTAPAATDPVPLSHAVAELIERLPERARSSLIAFLHLASAAPDRAVVDLAVTERGDVRLSAEWREEETDASAA